MQDNFAPEPAAVRFAVAALELLDPRIAQLRAGRALIIEATLDSPNQVLYAQERKAKNELSAQLKADGVDYTERMNELDQVTYPPPWRSSSIRRTRPTSSPHPGWLLFEPRPKSIVRDMYERAMGFNDFVQYYSLERAGGRASALPL